MLGKWPNPNKLSEMFAWAGGLWIRRVLVRAQEGQLEGSASLQWCGACLFFRPLLPFLLSFLALRRRYDSGAASSFADVHEREVLPLIGPLPPIGVPEPTL
jgi:hypothetical protein